MRSLMVSALLGLGVLGFTATNEAKASWLSDALNNSSIQLNIGSPYQSQYPVYSPPVYAPVPVPVYRPVPVYAPPAYGYARVPVYQPAPVVPVYRPAPVNVPQHSYYGHNNGQNYGPNYGPNRFDNDRHDGRSNSNDRDWRR